MLVNELMRLAEVAAAGPVRDDVVALVVAIDGPSD